MLLKVFSSCALHTFRGKDSTASWATCSLHCSSSKNIPLISNCNFLSCSLWLLPLGFPVPPSGKGMICPITPYTTKVSCWFIFSLFSTSIIRYFSSELFLHLVLMNCVTWSQVQGCGFIFTELHEVCANHSCSLARSLWTEALLT